MLLTSELSASPFSVVLTLALYQNPPSMLNDSVYMHICILLQVQNAIMYIILLSQLSDNCSIFSDNHF